MFMRKHADPASTYPLPMYAQFFGLKQEPFSIAPDPRYLFMSKRHREALAHLLYGLNGGGGFVLLSGEIGAGKTTVCRCFLEQIPKNCNVAYIFNPKLTVNELLKSICDEFGIAVEPQGPGPATVKDYLDPLNAFLLKTHAVGQNNVLIIDEAQMLSADVLEQLRLLTNLETNERKLLQIVLIGQPELRTMLARPELEQLAQRVIARFHLKALSDAETTLYIRHRLAVGGMTRGMPFERHAIERIHVLARGIPRRINLLCDRALLGAYARGTHRITREIVDRAATEVFGRSEPSRARRRRPRHLALLALGIGLVAAAAIYAGYRLLSERGAQRGAAAAAGVAASAASARAASAAVVPSSAGAGAVGVASGPTPTAAASAPAAGASMPTAAASMALAASHVSAATLANSASVPAPDRLAASPVSSATPADVAASAPVVAATGAAPSIVNAKPAAADAVSKPSAPPKFLAANDLKAAFKTIVLDERQAWRELAPLWHLEPGNGEPCEAAQHHQVRCFKSASSLDFVRKLGRPGIVDLRDDSGHTVYALLTGLSAQTATLKMGEVTQTVSLVSFAKLWQGDFATYWRVPQGYGGSVVEGDSGPIVEHLATQLASLAGEPAPTGKQTMNAALRTKVARFQSAHGIKAVGTAGPTTFMQLNRATGVDEPWLSVRTP